jgi:hypothetical protein
LDKGENPRFVVTNIPMEEMDAREDLNDHEQLRASLL